MEQFDSETLRQVETFMRAFNDYLESQISKLGSTANED